jgi:hypothetical protein
MSTHPVKPITKPGEGNRTHQQKYLSQERYLEERYQISLGLKGPKRLEGESHEDFQTRRKAENGLLHEYSRGVWMTDGKCTALNPPCVNCDDGIS